MEIITTEIIVFCRLCFVVEELNSCGTPSDYEGQKRWNAGIEFRIKKWACRSAVKIAVRMT